MLFLTICSLASGALTVQSPGGEWNLLHHLGGGTIASNYGQELEWLGDLDGDGCDDFIVGAPRHDVGSTSGIEMGAVFVFSGRTGQELFSLTAAGSYYRLGWRVSRAGDIDGDSVPDFAFLMMAGTGLVPDFIDVRSGATFASILQIQPPPGTYHFGEGGLRGGSDFNYDGIPDLLVVDTAYSTPLVGIGAVFAFDGSNGSLLWMATGHVASEDFGLGVSCPGDLNGDGAGDVLAASYINGGYGAVYALSGLDGTELYRLDGPYSQAYAGMGGHRLDGVGDFDGDGLGDYFVGSAEPSYSGILGYGTIHRGYDGVALHRWEGLKEKEEFGMAVAGVGDVNADGVADLAVGAPGDDFGQLRTGKLYVFSGRTKEALARLEGDSPTTRDLGFSISPGWGDANGDGLGDVLVGDLTETYNGLAGAGAIYVFSFHPFLRVNTLTISNSAGGTLDFALDFPASEAGRGYRFLASHDLPGSTTVQGVQIPLVVTPLLLRVLHNPPALLQNPVGTLDANGDGSVSAAFPAQALPGYVGLTLKFAAISEFSPGQPSLSSAPAWVEVTP